MESTFSIFVFQCFIVLTLGHTQFHTPHQNEIQIHFADSVRSLEQLSQDTKSLFERAEAALEQVDDSNDEQGYFLDFIIESIAKAITQCGVAPFYPSVCELEPKVRSLQYRLRDKINWGKRKHKICKTMGTLAVEIQTNLKYISDVFVKVTNEAFEMINILEMMEYDQYNPLWKEQMEQAKDDLIARMHKMKNLETVIRGAIALVEIAIIALTPPNPALIIIEIISVGIALAESIKSQKKYKEQLQHAVWSLNKAIGDVDKANGRISEECGKLETSWSQLLENGKTTLNNVNAVTIKLREVMPKVYGGINTNQMAFSSDKAFESYNGRTIKGQTDNMKSFMVDEIFPRINGALEDLFGKFTIDQLPTMVWVTNEVVTKIKINSTISDIISDVKPKDRHFTSSQIMHLVSKMFPGRKCYQYYPLEPARNKKLHPTYKIEDINQLASNLQTTLFFSPLNSDCSNLNELTKSAQRVDCRCQTTDCDCVKGKDDTVYKYVIACLRPDVACAQKEAHGIHVCNGRE